RSSSERWALWWYSWRQPPIARPQHAGRYDRPGKEPGHSYPLRELTRGRVFRDFTWHTEDHVVHVHGNVGEVEHRDPLSGRTADLLSEADRERRGDHEQSDQKDRSKCSPCRERCGEQCERRRVAGHGGTGQEELRNVDPVLLQVFDRRWITHRQPEKQDDL